MCIPKVLNFSFFVGVQEFIWDNGSIELTDVYTFFYGKVNANHHLGAGVLYIKESDTKRLLV
jgi:hypothetical protein